MAVHHETITIWRAEWDMTITRIGGAEVRRNFAIPVVGLFTLAGLLFPSCAGATGTIPSQDWAGFEQSALQAASSYRHDGAVEATALPSPISYSTISTAQGQSVPVAEESVSANDAGGPILLTLSLLGREQLVVTEIGLQGSAGGATFVFHPDSTGIASTYPLAHPSRSSSTATLAAIHILRSDHYRPTAVTAPIRNGSDADGGGPAILATVGGCFPTPQAPFVIGSIFGPLIENEGVTECNTPETLAIIVSGYKGLTHISTAGGSGSGVIYSIAAFSPCTIISGTNSFATAQLWSVNAVLQPGATSGYFTLHCQ